MNSLLIAQHLGQLHAWEQVLVLLLAFGPFLLLGVVVVVVRRRDIAEEADPQDQPDQPDPSPAPDDRPGAS